MPEQDSRNIKNFTKSTLDKKRTRTRFPSNDIRKALVGICSNRGLHGVPAYHVNSNVILYVPKRIPTHYPRWYKKRNKTQGVLTNKIKKGYAGGSGGGDSIESIRLSYLTIHRLCKLIVSLFCIVRRVLLARARV